MRGLRVLSPGRASGRRGALLAAVPLLLASVWTAAEETDTLTLRYKPKRGGSATYRIRYAALGRASMPSMPGRDMDSDRTARMRGEMELRQRVVRIGGKGEIDLETQVIRGKETTWADGEEDESDLARSKVTTRMTPRGILLSIRETGSGEGAATGGFMDEMSAADFFIGANVMPFAKGPVKVGDEWDDDMEVALEDADPMQVKASSKLLAWATCLGRECAKIRTDYQTTQEFDEEMDGMAISATVTLAGQMTGYYAVADGTLVFSEDAVTAVVRTEMEGGNEMMEAAKEMLGDMDLSATIRLRANAKTVLKQ